MTSVHAHGERSTACAYAAGIRRGGSRRGRRAHDQVRIPEPEGPKAQIAAEGVEITKLSPEDVTKLRELAKPVVDKQKAAANPDVVKLLETELAKAQGKS